MRQIALALMVTTLGAGTTIAAVPSTYLEDNFTFLADYAYAEVPPPQKPADTVLASLKGVPEGTIPDEIKRASDAFGIDFNFMMAVAKIESDFDPKNHTGSYIGLYQLSKHEFDEYGDGNITDPRDNAIAAAYKFTTEATEFKIATHHKATASDLYLVHQQGLQGAEEHINHPERPAWQSMCATQEGKQKGEAWCKRAIWENTIPSVKTIWKNVDALTSGAFVEMWRETVNSYLFVAWPYEPERSHRIEHHHRRHERHHDHHRHQRHRHD